MKKTLLLIATLALSGLSIAQVNIADARTYTVGQTVTVSGIVTNGSELGGIIRYMEDGSGGIAVYDGSFNATRGDSVTVTGELSDFNGLLEVVNVSSHNIHSNGNTLPTPQLLTPNQLGETTEGELIRIDDVTFTNGGSTFSGSTNYNFTAGGQAGEIRVNNGSVLIGQTVPVGTVDMIALSSEFNTSYQVLPRDMNDFIVNSSIYLTSGVTQSNITTTSIDFDWTTNINGSSNLRYGPTAAFGTDINMGNSTSSHSVTMGSLTDATCYHVQVYSINGTDTAFSNTMIVSTAANSTGQMLVYFNKSVDTNYSTGLDAETVDLADTIAAYIDRAQTTLDVSMYNNDNAVIVNAINDAYTRGVTVRYVSDLTTSNFGLNVMNAAIPVHKGNNTGIMHNKFFVIDRDDDNNSWVLGGSTNITPQNLNTDFNNLIIIQDKALAKAYTMEFEEMWGSSGNTPNAGNSKFGEDKVDNTPHEFNIGGVRVELHFSPSDNVTAQLVRTVNSADDDLQVALLSFTRNDLGAEVLNRHNAGTDVKVIMENQFDTGSEYNYLETNGVPIFSHISLTGQIHHKYAIVDASNVASDPTVITGSHNWSTAAEERNDENTLIIHDATIANLYLQEFMARWNDILLEVDESTIRSADLKVFPNPSAGALNISYTLQQNQPVQVNIIDMTGKIVWQQQYTGTTGTNTINLMSTDLSSGVYHLQIAGDQLREDLKLVIAK